MAKNLRLTDTVTIASSGTVSTSITMEANRIPLAIVLPAALTGTSMNFQGSTDGSNFYAIYENGTLYAPTVGTSRIVTLNRAAMDSVKYIKLVSTSTETAARTIGVISGE